MKKQFWFALLTSVTLLAGCTTTPQAPIQLVDGTFKSEGAKIGVAMTPLPKVDTQFPGAGCLLCLAAATVANNSLTDHVRTLPPENISELKAKIAASLRSKGLNVTVIDEPIDVNKLPKSGVKGVNVAEKNFSSIKAKYNIDKLVMINVTTISVIRTYANYVPTSDPKATFDAVGYIVDLNSNAYDWYLPVNISKSADGAIWDEPPKFPGVTNAYFQALELGQTTLLKPLTE